MCPSRRNISCGFWFVSEMGKAWYVHSIQYQVFSSSCTYFEKKLGLLNVPSVKTKNNYWSFPANFPPLLWLGFFTNQKADGGFLTIYFDRQFCRRYSCKFFCQSNHCSIWNESEHAVIPPNTSNRILSEIKLRTITFLFWPTCHLPSLKWEGKSYLFIPWCAPWLGSL